MSAAHSVNYLQWDKPDDTEWVTYSDCYDPHEEIRILKNEVEELEQKLEVLEKATGKTVEKVSPWRVVNKKK